MFHRLRADVFLRHDASAPTEPDTGILLEDGTDRHFEAASPDTAPARQSDAIGYDD
jgi:hypothetical protein